MKNSWTVLTLTLAILPLFAQDSPPTTIQPDYGSNAPTTQLTVSVDVLADGTPYIMRAPSPWLPLAAARALREFKFEPRAAAYTTNVTLLVPPGTSVARPPFMPADPKPRTVEAIRVSPRLSAAQLLKHPEPQHNDDALRHHVEGTVILSVLIDERGKVADLRVVSAPLLLIEPFMEAVSQWEYRPFVIGGKPTAVITEVEATLGFGR